jgi:hypothetical protein
MVSSFQFPVNILTHTLTSQGVTIYYPQIVGLANQKVQNSINQVIYQQVLLLQQHQMKVQVGTHMEMIGHFEIKTNERGLLSLILSNYTYSHPMAHGFTVVKSLTFDVNTGKLYLLHDLFKPGSNYISLLSSLIAQEIKQRNLPTLNEFHTIQPNQDYYLADKSLVIYFHLYELTPYYVGFPNVSYFYL